MGYGLQSSLCRRRCLPHVRQRVDSVFTENENYLVSYYYVSIPFPCLRFLSPIRSVIFGGRFLMSFRKERFEARLLSLVHNFNMFAISLICMVGIFYGVFDLIKARCSTPFVFGSVSAFLRSRFVFPGAFRV